MKITDALFPGRAVAQPKQSFQSVMQHKPLTQQKPMPPALPKKAAAAIPPGMKPAARVVGGQVICAGPVKANLGTSSFEKTASTLQTARAAAHQGAIALQQSRQAHHELTGERLDARLVDLICKELVIEFNADGAKSRVANQDLPFPTPPLAPPVVIASGAAPRPQPDPTVRAAQAVELIERIETFIKDSRHPSLALTLNNSLGAKVEIERVGPREVALKIVGHRGPPSAEDIGRIRDEMQAHGLKVSALSIG